MNKLLALGIVHVILLLCFQSAHCATAPAFLEKLPFTIDRWSVMPPTPVTYYPDRGERFPYQIRYAEISPSGKYLLTIRIGLNVLDQLFDIYKIGDGSRIVSPGIEINQNELRTVVWDPADEDFIFTVLNKENGNGETQAIIMHQRLDGLTQQRLSLETENAQLVDVSNDGKWVLAYVTPYSPTETVPATNGKYVMISSGNPSTRKDADWAKTSPRMSPNLQLAAGDDGQILSLFNRQTARLIRIFSVGQTMLLNPEQLESISAGITRGPWWLPDSTGVLFNVSSVQKGNKGVETLWFVNTNGEVHLVTTGVLILAHSENGRYWLLTSDDKWYVVTAKSSETGK